MTDHQEEQAALHALHLLTAEEARILDSEMKSDARLRQTFEDCQEVAGDLGLLVPPDEAPPECRAEILAALRRQRKANTIPFMAPFRLLASPWVAWAAAAAIAYAAFGLYDAKRRLSDQVAALTKNDAGSQQQAEQARTAQAEAEKKLATERAQKTQTAAELAKLQQVNALARMEVAGLKSTIKRYEEGVVVIVWDNEKQEGKVRLEKMPPVQINKDYQLWVLDKGKSSPVSAGVIRLDDRGAATLTFKPIEPVKAARFAISVEKEGGVPKKSDDGPIIFVGP
jgi:anti-sigma-K factor RskA